MNKFVPFLKLALKIKLQTFLTFIFSVLLVFACEENEEIIVPNNNNSPVINWNFVSEENASISRIKSWYENKMNSKEGGQLRNKKQELAWFMAEHSLVGKGQSITAVPVMEEENESSLKTLYLFESVEGTNGFILEQKPDKRENILLSEDFSGEVSLYTIDGKLMTSSEMKHGIATKIKRSSIASRAMSTLRTSEEDYGIILDEIVIMGTRIESNGATFVQLATQSYQPVEIVFPGTTYLGSSGGSHNYKTPLSSYSSRRIPLNFGNSGPAVNIREIVNCFHQAGGGRSYSITIYVEQPAENAWAPWNPTNTDAKVGHTFFKLSMQTYNNTTVERIVGYYPKNSSINPVFGDHTDEGVFKNDNGRSFDVSITFNNVSSYNFSDVLTYLEYMNSTTYNLNTQNCTDIGLQVARRAGYTLPDPQAT